MIKRFRLPNPPLSVEGLVDLVSRSSFDGIHDLGERENFHGLVIDQRSEDQVNVIRHDDRDLEVEPLLVVVQTACEHDGAHVSRQYPAMVSAEGHKMLCVIDLKMRQLSAIKSLRNRGLCGDSRHRLSAERSSAGFVSRAAPAVYLEIFETLERLNSSLGISLLARKASFARPDSRWRLSPHDSKKEFALAFNNHRLDLLTHPND